MDNDIRGLIKHLLSKEMIRLNARKLGRIKRGLDTKSVEMQMDRVRVARDQLAKGVEQNG